MYIYYALHARLNCQGSNVSGDVKEMGDVTCPKAEDDDARSTRAGSVMSNTDTSIDDLLSLSCHACMMEGNISHVYHGCAFHEQCFGATIRSRHRQFRNAAADPDTAKKAIAEDVKCMVERPHIWRSKTEKARSNKKADKEMARTEAFEFALNFTQTSDVDGVMNFRDKITLTKRHFKVHTKKWEGYDSDTADDEFDRLHLEQWGRERRWADTAS